MDSGIGLKVPEREIADFSRRWRVSELALFGSVLREDFGPGSDVDVLVSFFPDARLGLFGFVGMQEELAEILGRHVDLVSRRAVQASTNEPRSGLGNTDAIFTLLPLTLTVDDTTGPRKGFIGLLQNVWSVAPTTAGWIKESLVAISGSNQTYLAFPETSAGGIAIRKT